MNRALTWLLLQPVFLLFALRKVTAPSFNYDEGFANVNAMRVGMGELPYLDFWSIYGPGTAYLLHGAHRLFGENLLTSRLVDAALVWALLNVLTALASRGLSSWLTWPAAMGMGLIFAGSRHIPGYAMTPALLLWALALLTLQRTGGEPPLRTPRLWMLGLLTVLCSLFRQDLGAYLALALFAALCWTDQGLRWRSRPAWVYGGAVALLGACCWLPWFLAAGWSEAFDLLVRTPAEVVRPQRQLPLPALSGPFNLVWAAVHVAPWVAVGSLALAWRQMRAPHDKAWLTAVAVSGGLVCLQAYNRADPIHVAPGLYAVALLVFACLGAQARMAQAMTSRWALGVSFAAVLSVSVLLNWRSLPIDPPCAESLARAHCIADNPDQARMVRHVQQQLPAGEPVWVANTRNQAVHYNDVLIYFLMGRPVPTYWHEMHPGVTTEAPTQARIIEELERHQIRHVILVDIPPSSEPNLSARGGNGVALDAHVRAHFLPVQTFGSYQLLARKP